MAEKSQPVVLRYCQVCGLPPNTANSDPISTKASPAASANEADNVADRLQSTGISSADTAKFILDMNVRSDLNFVSSGSSEAKPEEVKRLPGGKIKKKEKKEVIIEKVVRNKRKCITTVKGLEHFGVKLSDASKKLGKKFATGASVVKGPTDKEQKPGLM
ncbi:Translation initiation factor SUI1 family protein isoform 2 [Hibiscus syriacus]|uniref:Translation initiation factor SUI1 family protein isoform 2 n=1 Tax=Hibiscus syriacus TaxID=106335 RepID=A0A6A2Z8W1_HIBSY|nr:Translation initiation factor SUI1 family protein isoform 2 [Hibiscus syriacus]